MASGGRRSGGVRRVLVVPILAAVPVIHSCLAASLSQQDLQVIASARISVPTDGEVAIVYDPANSESHKDAEAIKAMIGNGLANAGVTLTPVLAEADALSAGHFALVIVAAGANNPAVLQALRAKHVLRVTGEKSAVQAGVCTMAIQSN